MAIRYLHDTPLDVGQVIALYQRTSLGKRRPVDRPDVFEGMIRNANLVITAWDEDKLVGIARALTDFVYVTYLADLAVDEDYQHQGIGRHLLDQVQGHTEPDCMVVLLAAPQANDYYPKLGFTHNPRAWMLKSNY
ncbi:GNAT family N-acetyltransferase [Cellvibrio japonicus]|nr:GNAT family N-acetyltransferase [Cellvibrio japonicus]QEI11022.1 GNAT family N-acetyltransferase [Cellvibrio japonicus]QEI14597.1 GNAT family N-acetyltransferase [Cellvibrio japonicus]QEI18176.1 GNAT family N-acetyltransferase [Cellvibrio japonicus]